MPKVVPLATRALGTEPGMPDLAALAGWVADHRGTAADLHAFQLDHSLAPQLSAGITFPCAGGLFCRDRIRESLIGLDVKRDAAVGELHVETGALAGDASRLAAEKREVWCALPAPSNLGITDRYYHDDEEWRAAMTGAYRTMMRAMRDSGVGGHVLICTTVDEQEIAHLAGKKVFFFAPNPGYTDFETLMEYQRIVAVNPKMLETAIDRADQYEMNHWILVDPDKEGIRLALSHFDPDQVAGGGYCTDECDTYWEELTQRAVYEK